MWSDVSQVVIEMGFVGKIRFEYSVMKVFKYSNNIRTLSITLHVPVFTVTANHFF